MIEEKLAALDGILAALQVSKKWLLDDFEDESDPIMKSNVQALVRSLDRSLQISTNMMRHYDGLADNTTKEV